MHIAAPQVWSHGGRQASRTRDSLIRDGHEGSGPRRGVTMKTVLSLLCGWALFLFASVELSSAQAGQVFSPTYTRPSQGSAKGDGSMNAFPQTVLDNTLGRNVGFGDKLNNSVYLRSFHASSLVAVFATPGISEMRSVVASKLSPGDFGGYRNYWNTICALTASADEACKLYHDAVMPVRSYTATVVSTNAGRSDIMTRPTDNCGMAALEDSNCSGGQRWLIDTTAAPVYRGTMTAVTFPSASALGTMRLSGSPNLPVTVHATVPAGVPDTTDALNGDAVTVTIAGATGRVPNAGSWCINGELSAEIDCGTYTASGTTLRLAGHRWPHSNASGAPLIFFTTPRQAVLALDGRYTDSNIGYAVLGNASADTVYWTAIGGGSRSGANLQQFASNYTAAGTNGITIYDAAYVASTEDPAKAGTAGSHDGYMRLGWNVLALQPGHTVSELLPPSTSLYVRDDFIYPTQFSYNNKIHGVVVNDNIPSIFAVQLANRHDRTVAGTGMHPLPDIVPIGAYGDLKQLGAFNSLMSSAFAPKLGLLITYNCQGGPSVLESGCPKDKEWAVWSNQSTGDGYYNNLNEHAEVYGHIGRYARESFAYKFWNSPNGAAGLVFPQGLTAGFGGCPLTPNTMRGATALTLGNSQETGAPCTMVSGANDVTESTVVASDTITPTTALFHVTGTQTIHTMTPLPGMATRVGAGAGGCVDFVTDAAVTFRAGTAVGQFKNTLAAIEGMLYRACYTPSTGLWYAK